MTDKKVRAALAGLWMLFTLIAAAATCGGSTEELCPRACRDVGLDYHSATAITCDCLKDSGEVVQLW